MDWILLVNLLASAMMCGLVWFVQVVHYPLFARVGESSWTTYHNLHARRTTYVVAPLMLIEAAASVAWMWYWPSTLANIGAGLVGLAWLSTFLVQVPLHGQLAHGFAASSIRQLVIGNWIRVVLWSARVVVVTIAVLVDFG
jgi:hypothetical protein